MLVLSIAMKPGLATNLSLDLDYGLEKIIQVNLFIVCVSEK